jgi:hypothetical protein
MLHWQIVSQTQLDGGGDAARCRPIASEQWRVLKKPTFFTLLGSERSPAYIIRRSLWPWKQRQQVPLKCRQHSPLPQTGNTQRQIQCQHLQLILGHCMYSETYTQEFVWKNRREPHYCCFVTLFMRRSDCVASFIISDWKVWELTQQRVLLYQYILTHLADS